MSTPVYSQSDLYAIVNGNVHSKFAQVNDRQVIVNRAVRFVLGDVDLRSTKRKARLSPNMFDDVYDYAAPSDLRGNKIIGIQKQINRSPLEQFFLVEEDEFDQYKGMYPYRIAIAEANFGKILKIDGVEDSEVEVLNVCDSLTANGTFAAVGGTDMGTLSVDTFNYISDGASIKFDTASGAATAAFEITDMTDVDLSDSDEEGSFFLWVYIPTDITIANLTNFILRVGNSSTNYWSKTVTDNNEGSGFHTGWNLLRFDWDSATETGTVDPENFDYMRLTITKTAGQAALSNWRVDSLVYRKGEIYDTVYYSKYGWQTAAGVYIEESTTTTDLVIADTDEIELIGFKAAEYASQELKEYEDVKYFKATYNEAKNSYQADYPGEALNLMKNWYN
jgi:hypothetical protein